MQQLTVGRDDDGVRLDRFLRRHLPHVPLSRVFKLVRTGKARVDGGRTKQDHRLREGERVEIDIGAAEIVERHERDEVRLTKLAQTEFFRRSFRVVFEDEALLVCNKPVGIVVHPGSGHAGHDTLIDLAHAYLLSHRSSTEPVEPWLVHRLDRDTSGLILLAKDRQALRRIQEILREGKIEKRYLAVCHGAPPAREGTVDVDLERTYERNDGTKVRVTSSGMSSRTSYRVLGSGNGLSLVEATLGTGRTHQIRVHMNHIGCPIVGDVRYGDVRKDDRTFGAIDVERRLFLHAARLCFPHPLTGVRIELSLPPPQSFERLLDDAPSRPA